MLRVGRRSGIASRRDQDGAVGSHRKGVFRKVPRGPGGTGPPGAAKTGSKRESFSSLWALGSPGGPQPANRLRCSAIVDVE